ncbi:uncharacterized protein LOC135202435 [Macrobrachium nipponense]|uniref:uncharacterized protein LOC135202435 n=1 Tax=Macrobrachium nipponense TaxID=159736 RepID=UPI0030C7EC0B
MPPTGIRNHRGKMSALRDIVILAVLLAVLTCQPASSKPQLRHQRQAKFQGCLSEQVKTHNVRFCKLGDEDPDIDKVLKSIPIKSLCPEDKAYVKNNSRGSGDDLKHKDCCSTFCSDDEWRRLLLNRFLAVLGRHMQ